MVRFDEYAMVGRVLHMHRCIESELEACLLSEKVPDGEKDECLPWASTGPTEPHQ